MAFISFGKSEVRVDGFSFNMAMIILKLEAGNGKTPQSETTSINAVLQLIDEQSLDDAPYPHLNIDSCKFNHAERHGFARWLKSVIVTVVSPEFEVPDIRRKCVSEIEERGGTLVWENMRLDVGYVLYAIFELVEGRLNDGLTNMVQRPGNWNPRTV